MDWPAWASGTLRWNSVAVSEVDRIRAAKTGMTDLAGKTVWITGASGGIGEALALRAAAAGARVVLSARRERELDRVRAACPERSRIAVFPLDLLDFDAAAAASQAAAHFGPIHILVNNAGVSQRGFVLDTRLTVYRQIMELDFFAPVALTQAVLPAMRDRREGHVVMIGSVVARVGTPLRAGYAAAKHALQGFTEAARTEAARTELWRDGIRFTHAMPGFVHTQISVNALTASGIAHAKMDRSTARGMSPDRCAAAVWRAVEGNVEETVIGGREAAFLQFKRYFPGLFSYVLKRAKIS